MDLQLNGKRAVVTGASRGIGRAIARQLALEGCDVAICARTFGPLQETAAELQKATGRQIFPIVCDMRDPEAIKTFIDQAAAALGGIEILVNSAARAVSTGPEDFESISDTELMEQLEEKVVGYFRCARAATPYLKKAGWGRIINLSGQYGRMPRDSTGHGARNAAVVNLTKSMANSLGPAGINAIAVYPGFTLTEAFYERTRQDAERDGKNVETVLAEMAHNTNIRHLVTPEDVAVVIAFLCSPLAIAIQGEAIAVNGGANADVHY